MNPFLFLIRLTKIFYLSNPAGLSFSIITINRTTQPTMYDIVSFLGVFSHLPPVSSDTRHIADGPTTYFNKAHIDNR
jgi:hypothetical protein